MFTKSKLAALVLLTLPLAAMAGSTISLQGNHGLEPVRFKDLPPHTLLDLRQAVFNVVNSRNSSPRRSQTCKSGPDSVNRYPFAVERSHGVRVLGGLFRGKVPLRSDWRWTYCNSAALRIEDSPNAQLSGQRVHRPWDAIRIDSGSPEFVIDRVWISNARDDCVENDYLMSGKILNSLFDGCFVGISVAPTRKLNWRANIEINGVLMRLAKFSYKGRSSHGLPVKMKQRSANLIIKNSVIAVEATDVVGGHHAPIFWSSISDCSNNYFLWLGFNSIPEEFSSIPNCFKVLRGSEARQFWVRARDNWIHCNGDIQRFRSDLTSMRSRCNTENNL